MTLKELVYLVSERFEGCDWDDVEVQVMFDKSVIRPAHVVTSYTKTDGNIVVTLGPTP